MKKLIFIASFCLILALIIASPAISGSGVCGLSGEEKGDHSHASKKVDAESCFGGVCAVALEKGGVREITYEQFQQIRASGEDYELLDTLSEESYEKGHIEGAESFPVGMINNETAPDRLDKDDKIIVYCGGFKCSASTKAAHRLMALGYENVLDYKGGLEDWQEHGHELED
ncbi:MAG: rhodanese-like domain-containing protein [Candidatus Omnitrophota bacterium]